jgi:acyl-CoA synthetase (AMP-forming)/AMP-acid ligase II
MKRFGIWQKFSWSEYYAQVKYFSLGLISLGLQPGDVVALIGDNEPEWFWGEFAIQAAGVKKRVIAVDLFPEPTAKELLAKYGAETVACNLLDRDATAVKALMDSFGRTGRLAVSPEKHRQAREDFSSVAVSEEQTLATIRQVYEQSGYILDPHTAVGVAAAQALGAPDAVCLATGGDLSWLPASPHEAVPPGLTWVRTLDCGPVLVRDEADFDRYQVLP